MSLLKNRSSGLWTAIQAAAMFAWLTNLQGTDSYYSVYILCALMGLFCLCANEGRTDGVSPRGFSWMGILSGAFSLAVVMANYPLFQPVTAIESWFNCACTLAGGFVLAYQVLLCALTRLPLTPPVDGAARKSSGLVFLGCFLGIAVIYLLYLFFLAYPGYLSTDSITSLRQIRSGEYVNNNPFWYTMVIQVCIQAGMALFGEINQAVALYSTVQILFMAACFGYCLVTLYQMGISWWWIGAVFAIYAFLPYNLAYSVTMWKDIPFSGAALLMAAALYRLLRDVGRSRRLNEGLFALGSLLLCLMRTNGWATYLAAGVIFFIVLRKRYPRLLKILGIVLILGWILTVPALTALDVEGTDFVETLGVPFQQVARVIANDRPLEQEEQEMLEKIFRMDRVKELYQPEIVDPIKFQVFRSDQRDYLRENIWDYCKLWIRLGLRYPGDYFQAWVELTKGFWNGGYAFWIYIAWSYPEQTGIGGFEMDNPIKNVFDAVFRYLEKPVILQPLYSIGLHVWLVFACCFVCAAGKRREALITVPILVLMICLWFGTPVYAEYRYAYPMFTTYPLILLVTVFDRPLEVAHENPS